MLSEWTKFRSLRSTVITLAVAVVITIGISLVFALVQGSHYAGMTPSDKHSFNAASTSLNGDLFAQLAFGVLGVLVMTGEYSTGMIRASLTAVPRRLPVLWAKIAVYTLCVGIIALIANLASFYIGQAVLSGYSVQVSLTSPGATRILVGATLYVTAVGIMGIAIGALVRSTAGGISTLVGLLFVHPARPRPAADELDHVLRQVPAGRRRPGLLGVPPGSGPDQQAEPVDRICGPVPLDGRPGRARRDPATPPGRLTTTAYRS